MWRAADVVRFGAGALDLLATRRQASLELGSPALPRDVAVYRVLGARQVLQAFLTARTGYRALGGVVDVLHLASMVPILLLPRYRRAAAVQIAFAATMLATAARD